MLTRLDRVQAVVADREAVAAAYGKLLGAEEIRRDASRALAAQRIVLRVGSSEVDLLEPGGSGPAADFLAATRGGLFAGGFSAADLPALRQRLDARNVPYVEERGELLLAPESLGIPGLRLLVTPERERSPAGLLRCLYEITHLTPDFAGAAAGLAALFDLERKHFVPIPSPQYGYDGLLTLFHPDRLDRVEAITPHDPANTMGRFFARRGPSLYMCYGESDTPATVRDRLLEHAPDDWTGPREPGVPDNLYIHPKALGGSMIGVSRTSFAWSWSGRPDRVMQAAAT